MLPDVLNYPTCHCYLHPSALPVTLWPDETCMLSKGKGKNIFFGKAVWIIHRVRGTLVGRGKSEGI